MILNPVLLSKVSKKICINWNEIISTANIYELIKLKKYSLIIIKLN